MRPVEGSRGPVILLPVKDKSGHRNYRSLWLMGPLGKHTSLLKDSAEHFANTLCDSGTICKRQMPSMV